VGVVQSVDWRQRDRLKFGHAGLALRVVEKKKRRKKWKQAEVSPK
jgi:hypothetical protein